MRTVLRSLTLAATAALFLACAAPADEKKEKAAPALSGTWARESNGLDLSFEFSGKDVLKVSVLGGENGAVITCKYTEKDGVLSAEITKVEEKGNFPPRPNKGLKFSFKWKVSGDVATLDDLKGTDLEQAKPVLEGEYERKKAKN